MCGISGFVSFKETDDVFIRRAVEKMGEQQSSRGPDDQGVFLFKNGAFEHRRLSIIDLSKDGHQPMIWKRKDGINRIAITFNGEIYNFRELKKELEDCGVKFHTKSDTEVILAGYDAWGIDIVKKLRGMFSFSLWDEKEKKVFLVRDRYGIKPLYYFFNHEKLIFASTVKAIEKSGEITPDKDKEALIGFLLFGSVPLPYTTLKDVYAVPASHYIEIDSLGNKKTARYYNALDFYVNKNSDSDVNVVSEKIRVLLNGAVRGHLISDAPLGVFLSGGLDSSALAALAGNELNQHEGVTTLSVHFEEEEFSEKKYQDIVAKKIGSTHREILVTRKSFYKTLDEFWESMDQPSIDGVNSYMISEAAKQAGLKVALSGLGSDEIFLGYANFKKTKLIRNIQLLPKILKFPLLSFGSMFGGRYRKLSYLHSDSILGFYLSFRGIFSPSEAAKILCISENEVWDFIKKLENELLIADYKLLISLSPADLLSYLDLVFYMQNQLLKDTDVMSMAHSIEIRVPFLDHLLVEYVASLSTEMKLSGKRQKQILIDAVKDTIPSVVWDRSKMGFTFPFQKWLSVPSILNTKYKILNISPSHWSQNWAIEVLKKFS